jgi:nucleoside 2-deoxyribosyltransferase
VKVYVAYRFSGGDKAEVKKLLTTVRDALRERGIRMLCPFFDIPDSERTGKTPRDFMEAGFRMLDAADAALILQASEERSEGMLMEVGYALARRVPVIVATQVSVRETYLPTMGQQAWTWRDLDDLTAKLGSTELGQ